MAVVEDDADGVVSLGLDTVDVDILLAHHGGVAGHLLGGTGVDPQVLAGEPEAGTVGKGHFEKARLAMEVDLRGYGMLFVTHAGRFSLKLTMKAGNAGTITPSLQSRQVPKILLVTQAKPPKLRRNAWVFAARTPRLQSLPAMESEAKAGSPR